MGICPSISPEQRATRQNNKYLKRLITQKLKDLTVYNFSTTLRSQIPSIQNRFLFNEGILQDIDKLVHLVQSNKSIKTQSLAIDTFEQDLRNSCLIMQDQMFKQKNPQMNEKMKKVSENSASFIQDNTQYQKNLAQNQSLVCQINIIYQQEIDLSRYHKALKLFLKWSSMFSQHFYGGFLKPLYKSFCTSLYKIPIDDLDSIVDETSIFVQFLVSLYTDIYHLQILNKSQNGILFKNENIFNLIMANIFKKTKIKKFVRKVIQEKYKDKIKLFQQKLALYHDKDTDFFGVQPKFQLKASKESSMNTSSQNLVEPPSPCKSSLSIINSFPYSSSFKLIENLCENSETPITKLKLIVLVSKKITSEIYKYYDNLEKQVPQLDPDNLMGIIMYLITKVNKPILFQELKVAECFTTGNCLTCISGYYLNVFNAAIETLMNYKNE